MGRWDSDSQFTTGLRQFHRFGEGPLLGGIHEKPPIAAGDPVYPDRLPPPDTGHPETIILTSCVRLRYDTGNDNRIPWNRHRERGMWLEPHRQTEVTRDRVAGCSGGALHGDMRKWNAAHEIAHEFGGPEFESWTGGIHCG